MSDIPFAPTPAINPTVLEHWNKIHATSFVELSLTKHDLDVFMIGLLQTQTALRELGTALTQLSAAANVPLPADAVMNYYAASSDAQTRTIRFIETVMLRAKESVNGRP